jgi:hypothetical protein
MPILLSNLYLYASTYLVLLGMNKSIIMAMIIAAVAVTMVASTIAINHAQALSGEALRRANNNLDQHIAAGGVHGAVAQEIKNRLNSGGSCGGCGT